MATKETTNKKPTAAAKAKAKAAAAKTRATEARKQAGSAAKGHAGGFLEFIRTQGVIGLAVGLAIGTAAGATVKVIVEELINPLVALITRGVDLSSLKWVIIGEDKVAGQPEVAIGYGAILSSTIVLLATALVIYVIIHFAKLDRLDQKKS